VSHSIVAPVFPAESLAGVMAAVEANTKLSATRKRDLKSAVSCVAALLGEEPGGVDLDLAAISGRLAATNPVAAGISLKRFANVRSDFLAAAKVSGMVPVTAKTAMTPAWEALFRRLTGRRAHFGLTRLARYAGAQVIEPGDVDDLVIENFIVDVRQRSLHRNPYKLHRQVTQIWNEVARDPELGLQQVGVPSRRGQPQRIAWSALPTSFRTDVDAYLCWASRSDPFAPDARPRALKAPTLRLRRDQIHAALTALVESGANPVDIRSLTDLVTPASLINILRHRLAKAGGEENGFNHDVGVTLTLIAREWVKVDAAVLAELKRLVAKMPVPLVGLTDKNKRFLRQFDDPQVLRRLVELPGKLWAEVKRESQPNFRTLSKAQAALAIAILTYMGLRLQNLSTLTFDTHLFLRRGRDAISTLELPHNEVKNSTPMAFDIPAHVVKMLFDYRDHVAPQIVGHRPKKLFQNTDGTPKSSKALAALISAYVKRRVGIVLSPHQFRHLAAKLILDDQPGNFEGAKQLLGHRRLQTTVNFYAGIDSRRAGRHHQHLIAKALVAQDRLRRDK
jgi:integrase